MQRRAAETRDAANCNEWNQQRGNWPAQLAQGTGHDDAEAKPQSHAGECSSRTNEIDNPSTGQHGQRVNPEECRINLPHLHF